MEPEANLHPTRTEEILLSEMMPPSDDLPGPSAGNVARGPGTHTIE